MATGTLISVEEYLSTAYDPDCEYVEGQLIDRNWGQADHSEIQGIVFALLFNRRREFGIHVFPELRVQVSATRYRVPDIVVTTHKVSGSILRDPPLLCIEILSSEDRASRIQAKIDDYLAHGVRHIWVIDPDTRKAWSYTREGKRESAGVLTTADPALTLSLHEVFESLNDEVEK